MTEELSAAEAAFVKKEIRNMRKAALVFLAILVMAAALGTENSASAAMVVKNNMSAVNTLNTLNKQCNSLTEALQKLSSGMKVNSAADDAIAEGMRVQVRHLVAQDQTNQNADSMMNTAEGAVNITIEILKTLEEKAISAANNSNTVVDQIDENATTTFNGKYLVDGSKASNQVIQKTDESSDSTNNQVSLQTGSLSEYNNKESILTSVAMNHLSQSNQNNQDVMNLLSQSNQNNQDVMNLLSQSNQSGKAVAVLTENNLYIEQMGETQQSTNSGTNLLTGNQESSPVILITEIYQEQETNTEESEPIIGVIADLENGEDGLQATFRMYGYTYRIGGALVLENGAVIQLGNPLDWSDLSQQFGLVVMDEESGRMNYYSTVGSEALGLFPGELVRNRQLVLSSEDGPIVVAFDGLGYPVYQGTLAEVDPDGTGIGKEFRDAGYANGLPGIPDIESFPEGYLGHHFERQVLQEPTCTEKGTSLVFCTDEGCTLMSYGEELPAAGHLWEATEYTWTRTEDGFECSAERVCARDRSHTESEIAAVTSETTAEPACGVKGQAVYTASFLNPAFSSRQKTVTLPALKHEWDEGTETDPTCLEAGTITRTCLLCGKTKTEPGKKAAGHDYQISRKIPATCEKDGVTEYVCRRCQDSYTETEDAKGHQYSVTKSAEPTCTESGYTIHTCEVCGNSYREEGDKALEHDFQIVETVAPTENAAGYTILQCSRCEETMTQAGDPPLSHDYQETENVPAACEADGHILYTCRNCGDQYTTVLPKTGHAWQTDLVTAATCEANGSIRYVCSRCGAVTTAAGDPAKGHSWQVSSTIAATCEAAGGTVYKCSQCGAHYTETTGEPLGHIYHIHERKVPCDQEGETVYKCDRCQTEKTVAAEILKHDEKVTDTVDATCEAAAVVTWQCQICGSTRTETRGTPLGHEYETVKTEPPTCLVNGSETYQCKRCQDTYSVALVAPGSHDYKATQTTEANCIQDGSITYVCSRCQDTYTQKIEKLGHDWGEGVTTPAGCLTDGYITYTCPRCGASKTEPGDKAIGSHDYQAKENVPSSCTQEGHITYVCSRCQDTYTKQLEKAAHEWDEGVVTPPTCLEDGYTTYTCKNCPATRKEAGDKAPGSHDYQEKENVPSDCANEGHITYECSRCHDIKTDPVAKKEHDWDPGVVHPRTCTEDGKTVYTCKNCSATKEEPGEKALGGEHEFKPVDDDDNPPFADSEHPVIIDGEAKVPVYGKQICSRCGEEQLVIIGYVQ